MYYCPSFTDEETGGERHKSLASEGGSQLLKPECASGAGSPAVQTTRELPGVGRQGTEPCSASVSQGNA